MLYTHQYSHTCIPQEPKLYIYDIEGDTITQRQEVDLSAPLTEIQFSPDGAYLGAGTSGRTPLLLDVSRSYKVSVVMYIVLCMFGMPTTYFQCESNHEVDNA